MSRGGRVRIVVRSRKVPARTVDVIEPIYSTSGIPMGTRRNRLVVYDFVLDEEHNRAIQAGQKLACNLGLELEIIDAGKRSILGRVLSLLGRGRGGGPTLEITPSPKGGQEMPSVIRPVR
jgi:hypothetical protein